MTKLYELTQEYAQLLAAAEDEPAAVEVALAELSDSIEAKGAGIARVLASIEADASSFKAEEQRLAARRKAMEANAERLKRYVRTSMQAAGITSIKGGTFAITLAPAADKVVVDDEKALPAEFVRTKTTTEPDKLAILAAYKLHGEIPPGCRIEPNTSLRIR